MNRGSEKLPQLPKIPIAWKWLVATLVVTVMLTLLLVFAYFPGIPDPMPVHWNAAGQADSFQEKSLTGFLGLVLMGPIILILSMAFTMAMISMQSGHISEPGGAKTAVQAHRTWLSYEAIMKNLGWFTFALNLIIMLMMVRTYGGKIQYRWEFAVSLVLIFGLCGLLMWAQLRAQRNIDKKYPLPAEEKAKWKGIFYNDPEDSRILVEMPTGSNFTFNIGRPAGKIWVAILFGAPVILVVLAIWAGLAG